MSPEEPRPNAGIEPEKVKRPADAEAPPSSPNRNLAEEYRKYREAEREEEKRLERYERTSSTDTTTRRDNEDSE